MKKLEEEEMNQETTKNQKEKALTLLQESYLKFSNCNNDQFNDLNYWKLPVPIDVDPQDLEDYEFEDA